MTSPTGPKAARADAARRARGFTLLELLLVVAIIGLTAGILVPYMARSIQGLGLQTATRDVIAAARGARAFAILRQRECVLVVDPIRNRLEVVDVIVPEPVSTDDPASGFDAPSATPASGLAWTNNLPAMAGGESEAEDAPARVVPEFSRDISPPTRITEVIRDETSGGEVEGIHWLIFQPNGMCDAFEIRLADPSGATTRIRFDPTSAEPEISNGR